MSTITLDLKQLAVQLQLHLRDRHSQLEVNDLQLLAHGEANIIFRLNQTTLVRVAVNTPNQRFGGDLRRLTAFEQTILQYLQGTEIGHTLYDALLEPGDDFPYSYLITNYLEGEPLNYSQDHLQKCAQTLAQLHCLPLLADYPIDRLFPQIPTVSQPLTLFFNEATMYAQPYLDLPTAEPEIVEMVQTVLARAASKLKDEAILDAYPHICLVHSDHTYENWVINNQRAYLIDWEWAELGSPAGDLGHFLSPVTVRRRQGYRLPAGDRSFFLKKYYEALANKQMMTTVQRHFAAFGVYPAVRSLCWTVGYWVTAVRWYETLVDDSPSARERLARLENSRRQFPELWRDVMEWLEEEG
jgi:thiamine kinase-like enzyme